MVWSMTGYGRGEARSARLGVSVEVKSVNHRYFEPAINLPLRFLELEARIKERLRAAIRRGHVDCNLYLLNPVPGTREPVIDMDLAQRYVQALRATGAKLGLAGEPDLRLLASLPEVVRVEERPVHSEALARLVDRALSQALSRLQTMRRSEGMRLAVDIRNRLKTIQRNANEIKHLMLVKSRNQKEWLRTNQARKSVKLETPEAKRAVQETVVQSLRADVTEEIVRLGSHLVQFSKFLASREPVGRRLDFLLQEMNRETNTLGSKAGDVAIVHRVVAVKEELEKIREQVQNLE
jgi:uncharacterized protein (TIGR00255 family)